MSGWRPVAAVVENRSLGGRWLRTCPDCRRRPGTARQGQCFSASSATSAPRQPWFRCHVPPRVSVFSRDRSARFQTTFRSIGIRSAMSCDVPVLHWTTPGPSQAKNHQGSTRVQQPSLIGGGRSGNFVDRLAGRICDARLPRFATSSSDPAEVSIGPGRGLLQTRIVDHLALLLMMEWE
jgi:hypothetical protein